MMLVYSELNETLIVFGRGNRYACNVFTSKLNNAPCDL